MIHANPGRSVQIHVVPQHCQYILIHDTYPGPMLFHMISCYSKWIHVIMIPGDSMLFHAIPCSSKLFCVILRNSTLFHDIPSYSTLSMLVRAVPLYPVLFQATPCYCMLLLERLFHAIPYHHMSANPGVALPYHPRYSFLIHVILRKGIPVRCHPTLPHIAKIAIATESVKSAPSLGFGRLLADDSGSSAAVSQRLFLG